MDCANGVGAPKLKKLHEKIGSSAIDLTIVNNGTSKAGKLNEKCGADYVKIQQHAPVGKKCYLFTLLQILKSQVYLLCNRLTQICYN